MQVPSCVTVHLAWLLLATLLAVSSVFGADCPDFADVDGTKYEVTPADAVAGTPTEVKACCWFGYQRPGGAACELATCDEISGTWNAPITPCTMVACPETPAVENGQYKGDESRAEGSFQVLQCDEGFEPADKDGSTIYCKGGAWTPGVSTCVKSATEPEEGEGDDVCICRMRGDPIINSYDDQLLRLVREDRYLMSKLVTPDDDCWFDVEVSTVDTDRDGFTVNVPHSVDIEFATSHIHFERGPTVKVGSEEIDFSVGPFESEGEISFRLYENKDKSFIVFESSESSNCSISLGFSAGSTAGTAATKGFAPDGVVILEVSSVYSGRMAGLCGNCDGSPDFDEGGSIDDQEAVGDAWVVRDLTDEFWREE